MTVQQTDQKQKHYFGAGPSPLPQPVLEALGRDAVELTTVGLSVLEISHRSKAYEQIQETAKQRLRRLLNIPDTHEVLFLQGGASLQFAMVPMNFLPEGRTAGYILTGQWSEKAYDEAVRVGAARVAATGKPHEWRQLPVLPENVVSADDAYIHITSNETIVGSQWKTFPHLSAPLVADMSSDILSRPIPVDQFHLIYAGAQKNLGPAGVTVVIVRKDWVEEASPNVPKILQYGVHLKNDSKYNTPPVFAVHAVERVLAWVETEGGVPAMAKRAEEKAKLLYDAIDESDGFYEGVVRKEDRSLMNVTFRLANRDLEPTFLAAANDAGLKGLSGHRSVGGFRASLYNAVTVESCAALAELMRAFRKRHS
ncbi:3-phosphoserine/phosphohydroxythreonine transaminase [Alicyclobacillus contaminans]|uniref:3-phosphoserine/phosphohydroxythreonine transaminase n=1 Tax=Alicyclobacillus contaminans TaxID=392016 RepID=UPI001FDF5E8C|nr:3-phosphoserine/phosphohydroxythreonine transaminase [Alicyclobacillus contaminans]